MGQVRGGCPALALFTGGVVIANEAHGSTSVALSTLERRREIGIMKAIGLQWERVLGMLLLEYRDVGRADDGLWNVQGTFVVIAWAI